MQQQNDLTQQGEHLSMASGIWLAQQPNSCRGLGSCKQQQQRLNPGTEDTRHTTYGKPAMSEAAALPAPKGTTWTQDETHVTGQLA